MRILLAHNSLYYPSHGGGDRSNRLLMEALAARGHEVRVVARIEKFGEAHHERFLEELAARGITPDLSEGAARFELNGVDVRALTMRPQIRAYFEEQVEEFDPDVILTSTDDPAQLLFEVAVRASRARVVHLVRATIAVPFGPDSSMTSTSRSVMLQSADRIVGVSEYVARYIRDHGHVDAVHVPISLMEVPEAGGGGSFDAPYVTLANPCAVKGIDIFVQLAARMPHLQFAAVPTWGTNTADIALLRSHPNIEILQPFDNMNHLLRRTRVLLVPSLWAEARSRIVVEAMMRGVPVIASDIGGIPEAKLGVPYLIKVNPIASYKHLVDENMVPVAKVPPQNLDPWQAALDKLTNDAEHWQTISSASREAALRYAETISVEPFERLLFETLEQPKKGVAPTHAGLTADRQRLLALRLRQRAWFPSIETADPDSLRLFCFPHAGGGTSLYRGWKGKLGDRVVLCPALFPGREARAAEPPIDRMTELVDALTTAIRPHLDVPFAFFGHSMGAGVAFELARSLRRNGLPLPRGLYVSGSRAPQWRLNYIPPAEPDEAELVSQLRKLGGLPEDPKALRAVLPVLKADTRLYRNYMYRDEPPLDIPVFAYGGANDPNVRPENLEGWRDLTTAPFVRREFAGGHFYLRSSPEFLAALRADVQAGFTADS